MKENKLLYNAAIGELNDKQGFEHMGKAKGTKEQQFQTLWGQVYGWRPNVPVKIQHYTVQRAYKSWAATRIDRVTKLRTARYCEDRYLTIEIDPRGYKKGKLYPKFWGKLEPLSLRYNHRDCSLIGNNCLTIYFKYGRFYLSQPNISEPISKAKTNRVIALDPGIRSFATLFNGNEAFQITNETDLKRLAKLQAYHSKLHKKADTLRGNSSGGERDKNVKNWFERKKVYFKMSRIKRKIINLTKDLHRKLACYLARNYDVIYIPNYRIKKIYAKKRSNKTNRKNQLNWAWYKFVTELNYRCALHGSVTIVVSESYSSKTCSKCGHIHNGLGSNKVFHCPNCGHKLNRDLNGAINILFNSLYMQGCLG